MTDSYDVFISYASEDKEAVARPLAEKLSRFGLTVWFDEFTLEVGDSLMESIDRGLANSKYGIVVLSRAFLSKGWPKYELRGLVTKEIGKSKVVLPVWYDISPDEIIQISPTLADKFALDISRRDLDEITLLLIKVIRPDIFENLTRYVTWLNIKRDAERGYVSASQLKPGPIRHKTLPDQFLVRVKIVHKILENVIDLPLARFIEGFQRDVHPHKEIQVWERIVATYMDVTFEQGLSVEERRWIFSNLLKISMMPKDVLQELIASDDQFIKNLIYAYAEAVPSMLAWGDEG